MSESPTPPSAQPVETLGARLQHLHQQVDAVMVGKSRQVRLALTGLLAGGHLLIEDVPGVGKTTLAHALAYSLGLRFARIQFTADLMPSDLVGVNVYERAQEQFTFHPGPVFTQVLLADEINRAGPRTQSALLEAMEERQVSLDGVTRPLPSPFFVIATQNPSEQLGTFPLPESQLDRFLMCLSMGYPDSAAERALLEGEDRREMVKRLKPVMSAAELQAAQKLVSRIHAAPALLDYVQALLAASRNGEWFLQGLSPRAGLALLRASRAHALLDLRQHVTPADVQAVAETVLAHRLQVKPGTTRGRAAQLRAMIQSVGLV